MADMKQLVDNVFRAEPARVEDDRDALLVVGADPDEAVPHSAELIAHREDRDPLRPDLVLVQVEPPLPAGDQFSLPRRDGRP
jgi:hypothetical protein